MQKTGNKMFERTVKDIFTCYMQILCPGEGVEVYIKVLSQRLLKELRAGEKPGYVDSQLKITKITDSSIANHYRVSVEFTYRVPFLSFYIREKARKILVFATLRTSKQDLLTVPHIFCSLYGVAGANVKSVKIENLSAYQFSTDWIKG